MEHYQFYYPNSNITQTKILIKHFQYLEINRMPEESEEEEKIKALAWKELTKGEEWFTDKSPFYEAISTGIIDCNGNFPCIITKIN